MLFDVNLGIRKLGHNLTILNFKWNEKVQNNHGAKLYIIPNMCKPYQKVPIKLSDTDQLSDINL